MGEFVRLEVVDGVGTIRLDRPAEFAGSNTKLPYAIRPAPAVGRSSAADTSTCATKSAHHSAASEMLVGLSRTTSPQPTRPSP